MPQDSWTPQDPPSPHSPYPTPSHSPRHIFPGDWGHEGIPTALNRSLKPQGDKSRRSAGTIAISGDNLGAWGGLVKPRLTLPGQGELRPPLFSLCVTVAARGWVAPPVAPEPAGMGVRRRRSFGPPPPPHFRVPPALPALR